jgi:gluconokinase
MPLFAGLDLGTTHTKLLVLDEKGNLLHQVKAAYTKGFGAQLDPQEILTLSLQLLVETFSHKDGIEEVVYLSLSAAMHSLVLVNENCHPLSSMTTWADTNSQDLVANFRKDPLVRKIVTETGTPFHPMTPFAKLWQIKEQHPDLLKRAFKCIGIKEFIWYHLTGYWEIDHSMAAATGMYNPLHQEWHPLALELTGIRNDQLPEICSVERRVGQGMLNQQGYQFVYILGGSDGCLAQIGSRAMQPGVASLTIGTSGAIRVVLPEFKSDPDSGLFSYQLDPVNYVCGGPTNNGGIVLQWWEEKVMGKSAPLGILLDQFEKEAASVMPGCEGMVCLPYFGGERAPVWDASASGMFAGIRMNHHQSHFKRAMVEGVCFIFKQLLQRIEEIHGPVLRIIASGGFTQSEWWLQVMSDVLERSIEVGKEDADASALGAIGVGMKAAGLLGNWTELEKLLPYSYKKVEPDSSKYIIYRTQYNEFLRLCHYS